MDRNDEFSSEEPRTLCQDGATPAAPSSREAHGAAAGSEPNWSNCEVPVADDVSEPALGDPQACFDGEPGGFDPRW